MNAFFSHNSLRFLLVFFGVFGLGYALLLVFPPIGLENALAGFTAKSLGLQVEGNRIFVEEDVFVVGESCTGLLSGLMLAGIVFGAGTGSVQKKIAVVLLGAAVLFVLNAMRLLGVVATGQAFGFEAAHLVHIASWFCVSIAVIGLGWFHLKSDRDTYPEKKRV